MGDHGDAGKSKWRVFDNKNYRLLWTGSVTSNIGFSAVGVAYPLVTLDVTGSPVLAGCAAFAGALPHLLFAIPAGMAADLKNRYRILLACQRIGLMATLLAAVAAVFRVPGLWLLLLMAASFVESTAQTFFYVGELAFVRTLVSEQERPAAYAMFNTELRITQIVGRTTAAGMIAIARGLPFVANAVSYLYCLRTLLAIRDTASTRAKNCGSERARLVEWNHPGAGLRLLFAEPFLLTTAVELAVIEVAFAVAQLHLVLEIRAAAGSPVTIGVVLGGFGVGGFLGALVASWLTDWFTVTNLLTWALGGWALLLVPIIADTGPVVLALCWTGIGAITAVAALAVNLCYLRLVPDDLLGRTEGALTFVMVSGAAVGALLSGMLPKMLGASTTGWVLVAGMALAAFYARRLREPRALALRSADARGEDRRIARVVDDAEHWIAKVVDLTDPIIAMFGGDGRRETKVMPSTHAPTRTPPSQESPERAQEPER